MQGKGLLEKARHAAQLTYELAKDLKNANIDKTR
jgi:hypothetical protein